MPAPCAAKNLGAGSQPCQGTTLRHAEKLEIEPALYQGTTLVVPIMRQNNRGALAPEGFFPESNTKAPCPILSPFFWRKGGRPRTSTRPLFVGLLTLTLLTGCKPVGPNYNRPGYEAPPAYKETGATAVLQPPLAPTGGAWQPANPSDGLLRGKWWEIYQDPQLNQLEDRIAANNQPLRQALESYLAARDQITVARAAFYPTLSAGPSATPGRRRMAARESLR